MEADEEAAPTPMSDETTMPDGIEELEEELLQPRSGRKTAMSGEQMDIEAYVALYSGRTKVLRLLFIAEQCENQSMQQEALRMAYDDIRKGEDSRLYRQVVQKIDGRLGPLYEFDQSWAYAIDRRAEQRKEKLENELNDYRTNLIKESIRMGYTDFGDFYYAHGQIGEAFKNYVRTRDYCTTSKHVIQMCLNAILTSIELGEFAHVSLAHLETKKYKLAARKFLETGPELGNNYSEVIAPQDVATYGGLCALASFDRTELKLKYISYIDILCSRYASCLDHLENLKPNLLLDIHLHDHVEPLYAQIRHKAIIQYTHPFISVDLHTMACAFKTTVPGLQKELEALIADNQIQARIDSQNKILYARLADQRNSTFQRALQTGVEFEREVRAMLLRANLIKLEHNQRGSRKL
ncbi:hypothetical protein KFK09_018074 [Dendrobium nobile]|uniref:PCI domain-containing protein n=1 Tax=Dendrobium nobile TaxID=94219 RepID=A0A8T3ATC1_DENNO|nr:hypothetical protein KFK09_018074 [Dendrobium nobile]